MGKRYELRGGAEGNRRVAGPLLSALVAGFICGTAACNGENSGSGDAIQDAIQLDIEVVPQWPPPNTPLPAGDSAEAHTGSEAAVVYLDVSLPMGGFLPPNAASQEASSANAFRTIVQWVPDQLTRAYSNARLTWHTVGSDVQTVSSLPRLERSEFDAGSSRIDLAIDAALGGLQSGALEAAAIVSDLLVTGENLPPGPLGLLPILEPWMESTAVRSGELHLGILGAKANYWGIESATCRLQGDMGCWYSERGREWRRLNEAVPAPFYVLFMAKNAVAVQRILESISNDAAGEGIETVSELLTTSSMPRRLGGSCTLFARNGSDRNPQYSLRLHDNNVYTPLRDDPISVACQLEGFRPTRVAIAGSNIVVDSNSAFMVVTSDRPDEFEVSVRAAILRSAELRPDLIVGIEGVFADDRPLTNWDTWSTATDDVATFPAQTLQLTYFVNDIRLTPDHYRNAYVPILRSSGR